MSNGVQTAIAFFATLAVLSVFGWVGQSDYEVEVELQSEYCERVSLWLDEGKRGVPKAERAGWPDYNRNYSEVCQ